MGFFGVDLAHYEHPLPEDVYDIYMSYWGNVAFKGRELQRAISCLRNTEIKVSYSLKQFNRT